MRTAAMSLIRRRLFVSLLIPLLIGSTLAPIAAATPITPARAKVSAPTSAQLKSIKRGPKSVTLITPTIKFSAAPSDLEIENARVFLQQLLPTDASPVVGENEALASAITAYKAQKDSEDISEFKKFIAQFPKSRWRQALEVNIGENLFQSGYLTEALADWRSAWEATKTSNAKKTRVVADLAVTDLMVLEARLGLTEQLEKDVSATEKRKMFGSDELRMSQAKQSVKEQKALPGRSYMCGPKAVNNVIKADKRPDPRIKPKKTTVEKLKSTKNGTNLAQLKNWTDKLGKKYQIAKRSPGAPLVVPSVIHWRLGHFGALTAKSANRYHLQDPTFDENGSVWLTQKAIDAESDGYFLIPDGNLPVGWTTVSMEDAAKVWGKGEVSWSVQGKSPAQPKKNPGPSCSIGGMAVAETFLFQGTLNIHDTPLSYKPPVGPAMDFLVNYNYLEGMQPSSFNFTTLGQDWSLNWVSYLTLDASQNATVHVRGGGYETYNYTIPDNIQNPYVPDLCSQALLTVPSVGVYHRQLPDGSVEVFNQPDGSGRIFMTQVIDPQGNAVCIHYDSYFRVAMIVDAIGQATTLTYCAPLSTDPGFYVLAQIEDPFHRTAIFAYDSTFSFLISSTDQIGLVSSFVYDTDSSFINLMTTPYGSTGFSTVYFQDSYLFANGVRFDYPDGTSAVVENVSGDLNESCYWDRETMMEYPLDYTEPFFNFQYPKTTSWTATGDDPDEIYQSMPVANQYASPIDYPIVYTYAGQGMVPDGHYVTPGPINKPTVVTQNSHISNYQYNTIGNMTQSVDPVGRTVSYSYAANNIDLLEKRQTTGTNNDLLGKWQYNNNKHLPNKYIDGSGQVTTMTYNNYGELLTRTDSAGSVWTNVYDTNGYLIEVDGPLAGTQDKTTIAYDTVGRVSSVTDSEGYQLVYAYDNGDRLTSTTYPDGTFDQNVYDRLDVVMSKDRIGRWTKNAYDTMDQMIATIDPLGRKTQYELCACGAVATLIDPLGQKTFWSRDLEARVTSKMMNDQTSIKYTRDQFGRVTNKLDALGQTTNYSYNLDDTLAAKTYTNAVNPTSEVDYTWDPNYPRLSSVSNGWGAYNYSYVPYITDPFGATTTGAGKLQSVTNTVIANSAISYSYDNLGRVTNRSINTTANSDNWTYDAISRITNETNTLGSFNFHYVDDTPGSSKGVTRLASVNYPNSQVTNYSWYDNTGDQRLQQINNLSPSSTILSQFKYQYDSAGEIVQWSQQAGSNPPLQYGLGYDPAGQLTSANATLGNSSGPTATNYNYGYDAASNRTAVQQSIAQTIALSGTITAGDTLTITVANSSLSGGSESLAYTVISGDTLATIATKIAAGLTSNSDFRTIGVNASSNSNLITIRSISQNTTTYTLTTSTGATESLTQGVPLNGTQNATIGGTATSADVLTITVSDLGLSGGATPIAYTVPSGASLSSIATGISSAINANTSLQNIGVSATSFGNSVSISSTSSNATTYAQSVSTGATETISITTNLNGVTTGVTSGTVTAGNTLSLTVFDNGLTSGSQTVNYTASSGDSLTTITSAMASAVNSNTGLQNIGVSATSSSTVLNIKSKSLNSTTYSTNNSSGATSNIALAPSTGIQQSQYNSVNELVAQAPGGLVNVTGNTNKPVTSINAASSNIRITAAPLTSTVSGTIGSGQQELLVFEKTMAGIDTLSIQNVIHYGDSISLTVKNLSLPGGQESVSYTLVGGGNFYTGLTAAINSDANLQAIGYTATTSTPPGDSTLMYFYQSPVNITTYTATTSSGATESVSLGVNNSGSIDVAIKGTTTAGDIITLSATNPGASSPINVTYTVTSTDSLISIASNIAALINSNSSLQSFLLSASNTAPGNLLWSESFQTSPILSGGKNLVAVTGQDGSGNQKTNQFPLSTTTNAAQSLTYDLNGNMTSDGTNNYLWDAENRLIQINYPGSGNYSQFVYDGLGRNSNIVETASGSVTTNKQFLWSGTKMSEERDNSGTLTAQYFNQGQTNNSVNYYYTKDHLGSVKDVSNGTGTTISSYAYDPFGNSAQPVGSVRADFQYAGYYFHAPSGLSLTLTRAYNPKLGRWINRDQIGENGGTNLFGYVAGNPISKTDPYGMLSTGDLQTLLREVEVIDAQLGGPTSPYADVAALLAALAILNADIAADLQQNADMFAERLAYHAVCDAKMPLALKNGNDECAKKRWKLLKEIACVNLRTAYAEKWGAYDAGHIMQINQKQDAITKLRDYLRDNCPPPSPPPGSPPPNGKPCH